MSLESYFILFPPYKRNCPHPQVLADEVNDYQKHFPSWKKNTDPVTHSIIVYPVNLTLSQNFWWIPSKYKCCFEQFSIVLSVRYENVCLSETKMNGKHPGTRKNIPGAEINSWFIWIGPVKKIFIVSTKSWGLRMAFLSTNLKPTPLSSRGVDMSWGGWVDVTNYFHWCNHFLNFQEKTRKQVNYGWMLQHFRMHLGRVCGILSGTSQS